MRWLRNGPISFAALALLIGFGLVGEAGATDPRAKDGGLNDLVIYLASDHPRGLPEVEFRQITTELDRLGIAIPPAVHVHRYYYNGNKQYQGPFVVGGPTVVVARHPNTNEQLYVELQLPSGYPEIAYDDETITYIYSDRRVQVRFLKTHPEKFAVSYLPGRGAALRLHEAGRVRAEVREENRANSPLRRSIQSASTATRESLRGLASTTGDVVGQAVQTVGQVVSNAPGIPYLRSRGREATTRIEENRFRTAIERVSNQELIYRPTIR
ncbi:hypothetical protein [Tautonia marina]|uniref:hypothetical protein n=1 Tax=Tautonia marina TaxID=2653855 RepID=UPI00126121EA|nr:hypothetical protein [Tautonia marina]